MGCRLSDCGSGVELCDCSRRWCNFFFLGVPLCSSLCTVQHLNPVLNTFCDCAADSARSRSRSAFPIELLRVPFAWRRWATVPRCDCSAGRKPVKERMAERMESIGCRRRAGRLGCCYLIPTDSNWTARANTPSSSEGWHRRGDGLIETGASATKKRTSHGTAQDACGRRGRYPAHTAVRWPLCNSPPGIGGMMAEWH